MEHCAFCAHNPHKYSKEAEAICTLWPEWKRFPSDHYCGQYNDGHQVPAARNIAEKHRAEWARFQSVQQDRAIKAEKALKAVRAELRALKSSWEK